MEQDEKKDIFDRIMGLPVLRIFEPFYQKNREVLLYLFFGAVTTLVSILTYYLGSDVLGMDPLAANVISWILAVAVAFFTNRTWVFKGAGEGSIARQAISFYTGRLATLGGEELILFVGIKLLHFGNLPVKVFAQVVIVVLNYVISKLFIFRKK